MSSTLYSSKFKIFEFLTICLIVIKTCNGETFKISNDITSLGLQSGRNSKLFPFWFAVLKLPTGQCSGDEGAVGVCYSYQDCAKFGGLASGSCAEGFGTCCVFNARCSSNTKVVTIRRNVTHIVTPESTKQPCRFVIPKLPGICQIRLDFNEFSLTGSADGNCVMDVLTINGADNVDKFELCGNMEQGQGSHLYLHYGESDSISLTMNLERESSTHNIQVTMIRCNDLEKAPDGCTQYFTEEKGQVRSFNFPQEQLNSQKYMVCVKTIPGSKEITWSPCNPNQMRVSDFFISGTMENVMKTDCPGDYIAVVDSTMGKYCGSQFTSIQSQAKPYLMWVNFNDVETIRPSGQVDANGCPFGWMCVKNPPLTPPMPPVTAPPEVCNRPTDICTPPAAIESQNDDGNTGFCLQYSVK